MTTPAVSTLPRKAGRPPSCSPQLAMRIIRMRHDGLSYEQIADALNVEQVPTPMGGTRWLKSHVDRLLHTRWVKDIIKELGDDKHDNDDRHGDLFASPARNKTAFPQLT